MTVGLGKSFPKTREVRSDAQIGNVAILREKAPELIAALGPKTEVGKLREVFGQRSVAQIAALPKEQRALQLEEYLGAVGVDNRAARGAIHGAIGTRALEGKGYYFEVGGRKLDRELFAAFVRATAGLHDHLVSAADARDHVVPALVDGRVLTPREGETYLFCLRHFKTTGKASREQLIPALRELTGAPVRQLENGAQGFEFSELYDHLQRTGRLADLYSAKTDMSDKDMLAMWDHGLSLEQLDAHLRSALAPKTEAQISEKFGAGDVAKVKDWLRGENHRDALQRLGDGKMSFGEIQNLIYGSWNMANTPYDAGYRAVYQPIPLAAELAKPGDADAFLGKLEDTLMRHDWKALLHSFDPENRRTQREIGVKSDAQYLAEGLGLHMVDNSLPGDIQKFDGLNSIRELKFDRASAKPFGGATEYSGTATLADGTVLKTSVLLENRGGKLVVAPAVG